MNHKQIKHEYGEERIGERISFSKRFDVRNETRFRFRNFSENEGNSFPRKDCARQLQTKFLVQNAKNKKRATLNAYK